jgi:hypothetical protein
MALIQLHQIPWKYKQPTETRFRPKKGAPASNEILALVSRASAAT